MQEFLELKREAIAELCRTHHVQRLAIFGSALRDDFDPARSDVDVRIEFDKRALDNYLENFHDLHDELTRVLGRRVDLISAETITNPVLRHEIERTQVTLYAS